MLSDEEREALRNFKSEYETCDHYSSDLIIELDDAKIILNLIKKQKNIIDSIKRILEDEELDYCDTLDEIYHFYEEVVNNDR